MKLFLLLYAQVCWLLPTFTCLAVFTSAFAVSQETTSSELFSLKAYLLHLPLLCVVMWWTDIDLLAGALWPQVLGSFVLFPYCIVWQFFFFFLNNVFCFLRDCCEYKKQSPTFSSDQSLCSSYAKYLGMYVSMEQGTLLSSSHCHQPQVSIYL